MARAQRFWFMLGCYRVMRLPALALAVFGLAACRRGTLQDDAGTGGFALDSAIPVADAPGADAPGAADGAGLPDVPFPTADANCGKVGFAANRLSADMLIVLDRAIGLDQSVWNKFLSGLVAAINANASQVDWGLYAFPQDGPICGAGTVSTTIDVQIVPDNATHVIAHLGAAGTGASSTPTAAAIRTAAAYMLSLTDQNPKFMVLVTDGAPDCAGTTDPLSSDRTQAQADAVAAIEAAYAAGIPTFVFAPSTATDPNDLNALAQAGHYPHAPPGPAFTTETTIGEWLTPATTTSTCTFNLGINPPPVPDVVRVTFNDATVPRDQAHILGWDYTDASMRSITFFGAWCEQVMSARSLNVTVYFGCPNPG
jgi:hypothetical protein